MDILEQCIADMVDVQQRSNWASYDELAIRESRSARDAERKRERRELVRLSRPAVVEQRTCPRCGKIFRVEVGKRPGRLRVHCSDRCATADRVSRHRAGA